MNDDETTKAGKAGARVLEPLLTPLIPDGPRVDPKAYVRFRDDALTVAPDFIVGVRQ